MAPRQDFGQIVLSSDLYRRSKELATYVVKKELGRRQSWDQNGEKLYELCREMQVKHELLFNSMTSRLNLTSQNLSESIRGVMENVFADGCNFGRIVSLYTFCITLCDYCCRNDLVDQLETIVQITAESVYSQRDWFERHGSWDGFISYFTRPEEKLWKGVVITTVGLGAVAGLIYANS